MTSTNKDFDFEYSWIIGPTVTNHNSRNPYLSKHAAQEYVNRFNSTETILGELDQPKQRNGETADEFFDRSMDIQQSLIAVHMQQVCIVSDNPDGREYLLVRGSRCGVGRDLPVDEFELAARFITSGEKVIVIVCFDLVRS